MRTECLLVCLVSLDGKACVNVMTATKYTKRRGSSRVEEENGVSRHHILINMRSSKW